MEYKIWLGLRVDNKNSYNFFFWSKISHIVVIIRYVWNEQLWIQEKIQLLLKQFKSMKKYIKQKGYPA